MHAFAKAGMGVERTGLCRILAEWAGRRKQVRVVFDGRGPEVPAEPCEATGLDVEYSGPHTADEVIIKRVLADTAPRRLTVVSSDREIRRAARRRRCKLAGSEAFAESVVRALRRAARPRPTEPPEKRQGLSPDQAQAWLRELNLEDADL